MKTKEAERSKAQAKVRVCKDHGTYKTIGWCPSCKRDYDERRLSRMKAALAWCEAHAILDEVAA